MGDGQSIGPLVLEQAIERDQRYGAALAWAAVCYMRLCGDGLSKDSEVERRKGADYARRALQVACDDPGVLANTALALAFFGEDIDAMMALVDRALALNPSFARGLSISGTLRWEAGQPDVATEHAEAALRLSPRGRIGAVFNVIGGAMFVSQHFDAAIPKLLLAIHDESNFPQTYRLLAACYAHHGRLREARETIVRLRAITPLIVSSGIQFRDSGHRELYLSGLRLAAGEEDTAASV